MRCSCSVCNNSCAASQYQLCRVKRFNNSCAVLQHQLRRSKPAPDLSPPLQGSFGPEDPSLGVHNARTLTASLAMTVTAAAPLPENSDDVGGTLDKLNLTKKEVGQFEKAFKDPKFLQLFQDYARDVQDPESRAETDAYLQQLERDNQIEQVYGRGTQLVVPAPEFVIKGRTAPEGGGTVQKVFVNVCTSEKVRPGRAGLSRCATWRGFPITPCCTGGPRVARERHATRRHQGRGLERAHLELRPCAPGSRRTRRRLPRRRLHRAPRERA